ncbi:MAG TPA: TetR/AcrR family transcriptional regulator [Egibacteraceae bacterium]|nr:TetR/AcrR family transcriptional regulator [Egibacteraceae bacterium]
MRELAFQATRERILQVAAAAFTARDYDDVTLRAIATGAGAALQTVVNHFGTKDQLLGAVTVAVGDSIESARWSVEPGNVPGAIELLVDDYERTAEFTLRMLSLEERVPSVLPSLERGRQGHEAWVAHVFGESLSRLPLSARRRRLLQLIVVTDIYTWKLLRRDKGLDRKQTTTAMLELALALTDET